MTTVKEIGEQGLLKRLKRYCPPEIIGDDAAVLETDSNKNLVVTTDMLVDEVHFSDRTTSPQDVGWRATAANLSDLAAMGASPLGITVSLGLQGDVPVDWVESLYEGLSHCLQTYSTMLVGGDVCRSPVKTISITAFGQVSPQQVIRRSTASPEDAIMVTGVHGASRAGLELLLHPEIGFSLSKTEKNSLIQAHQRPHPRFDVLNSLWEVVQDTQVAGMDSSDGLADAVIQICRESGVGAEIDRHAIPIPFSWSQKVSSQQALEWALYGGEDFELVLCLPLPLAEILVKIIGKNAKIVGKIIPGEDVTLVDSCGTVSPQTLTLDSGFLHF